VKVPGLLQAQAQPVVALRLHVETQAALHAQTQRAKAQQDQVLV
jgi:hypothetical protein